MQDMQYKHFSEIQLVLYTWANPANTTPLVNVHISFDLSSKSPI